MPYIIRPRKLQSLTATLVGAAMLLAGAPAAASAACPPSSTSTPFAQFGDNNSYSPLAGGSFESGAAGWSLAGAEVIGENESYRVNGGSHSLLLEPNGVAVSPAFCVGAEEPMFRLFARRRGGSSATTTVVLSWTDTLGATHNTLVGVGHPGAPWSPTPYVGLSVALPSSQALAGVSARIVFVNGGESAVAMDDVYIDPYRR